MSRMRIIRWLVCRFGIPYTVTPSTGIAPKDMGETRLTAYSHSRSIVIGLVRKTLYSVSAKGVMNLCFLINGRKETQA